MKIYIRDRIDTRIKIKIFYFDTIINYRFSKKFKLLRNSEFNNYSNDSNLLYN